jgi:hypothetical protein
MLFRGNNVVCCEKHALYRQNTKFWFVKAGAAFRTTGFQKVNISHFLPRNQVVKLMQHKTQCVVTHVGQIRLLRVTTQIHIPSLS